MELSMGIFISKRGKVFMKIGTSGARLKDKLNNFVFQVPKKRIVDSC